ncbi:MAG: PASTA domain-containing protein [Planctomycetales bacterium]|nr:PASTA domain-containing protein [Planctomycetales bacterium]
MSIREGWLATAVIAICLFPAMLRSEDEHRAVPDVQGQPPAVARQLLRLSKLQLAQGVFYIAPRNWRDDIRPGVVYVQVPPPRTPLLRGGVVAAWAFVRAEDKRPVVETPDLKGLTVEGVRETLAVQNLVPMKSPTIPPKGAFAVDQYPRPGQKVFQGTHVFVSWVVKAE